MKTRRNLLKPGLLLLACVIVVSLMSACSNGVRDSHHLLFWTSIADDIDMAAQQHIVQAFEKQYPDMHVDILPEPSQGTGDATALITAVRGGSPPDAYLLDRYTVSQQASIGLLTDLTPLLQKNDPNLANNYEPFAWGETLYQGHVYGMPMDTDSRGMFYNKDLVQKAGVDLSLFDPANGPMTIDEAMAASQKMTKTDSKGNYTQLGLIPWSGQAFHTTWALELGARFFDPKTCQIIAQEPAMLKTMQYFQQWAKEMNYSKVDTYNATYQPPNAPPSQTPFLTGHLGMAVSGPWDLSSIQQYAPKLNYGVTYMPVANKGDKPFTWSGGFALVMPTGAQNQAGAYQFMKFMTGPDGQRIYTKETGHLPTWTSLLSDSSLISGNQKFFADILKYSMSRPPLPVSAQYSDALDTAQQGVLLGNETPEQALAQVQQRVGPQMQQFCPFISDWTNPRAQQ